MGAAGALLSLLKELFIVMKLQYINLLIERSFAIGIKFGFKNHHLFLFVRL